MPCFICIVISFKKLVLYLTGKYYIKLGHFHDAVPRRLHTVHETKEWFCSYGDKALVKSTADLICSVVNGTYFD